MLFPDQFDGVSDIGHHIASLLIPATATASDDLKSASDGGEYGEGA